MKNRLQKMVDEWYDGYVKQNGCAPTWAEFLERVNYFKFMLDIKD